ncbi:hypothetical protein H5410_040412 [Solanum commersonii]|uniref:Uncharacterized protein n=1 Tax=Solanum commersonii TaxID=4109 RepID=A0A9J5XQ31_SOLCO|nr:hypothetical protein H5410_040412 [Solanum commersonii]
MDLKKSIFELTKKLEVPCWIDILVIVVVDQILPEQAAFGRKGWWWSEQWSSLFRGLFFDGSHRKRITEGENR